MGLFKNVFKIGCKVVARNLTMGIDVKEIRALACGKKPKHFNLIKFIVSEMDGLGAKERLKFVTAFNKDNAKFGNFSVRFTIDKVILKDDKKKEEIVYDKRTGEIEVK